MTGAEKKKLESALDLRTLVKLINEAIGSPNLKESVIGKPNRNKLLSARSIVFEVIDEWGNK